MFFMPLGAAYFSPQGQRGGCGIKSCGGVPAPHSFNSFVFCGLPLLFGFHDDDTEKSGETIATPPKRGVPTGPDSGAEWHASIPAPRGSLSSVFIPAGRLGAAPQKGVLTERVRYPFPLVLHDSRSVLAVKGTLRRFAPWTAPGRSGETRCSRGKRGDADQPTPESDGKIKNLRVFVPPVDTQDSHARTPRSLPPQC